MSSRVKVRDYSAKQIKRLDKYSITALDKVADFTARKVRKAAPGRYSRIVTGVDERKKVAYIGFDNAGHYRNRKYWTFSILRLTLYRNIRGIVSAFRRQLKLLDRG